MAKKRGNGEGSIYRRPNATWYAQVSLQGKRIGHGFKTRGEAQLWIRQTLDKIDNGMTLLSLTRSLEEHLNYWLENEKAVMRPSTWTHYSQLVHMYIIPNLGKIKLNDLQTDNVQLFYTHLVRQRIGVHTIRKIHAVLHRSINWAVETNIIGRNPVSFAHQPQKPPSEIGVLNKDQARQFVRSIIGHKWEALFRLEIVTGMREMEILGLRWNDIDVDRKTVIVHRQLVRSDKTGLILLEPKTRAGRRSIDLDIITIELLKKHNEWQQSQRLLAGSGWKESGLLFTNSIGSPIDPTKLRNEFYKLLDMSGLPKIHFHDLRHTVASLLLNNGVPAIVVSKRLGHARVSITEDIYGHLLPGLQTEAAQIISDLVTPI